MSDASSQLWTLIARARQLPAAERDAFLVRECAERPDLLAEARAILVLVEQNQDLFEADTRVPTAPPAASDSIGQGLDVLLPDLDDLIDGHGFEFEAARCAERRGDDEYWIGPYRLIKLLGTGGFGAVFLAKRQEPIQFHVAIKVIQAGRASPAVLARFEQEREIIASLDHPGIARVIDAGTSPRGVPFVAIEYVPGEPLTTYCDRHQLTLEQRLDVFREVCDAVQHAHQRGVIHRDLKPGNILVRDAAGPVPPAPGQPPGPRKPVVKIIDWGIAKAMQPLRSTPSVKTEGQFSPMTLQYASPEQAGAGGISPRDLDVRTDVFSLGVILYELLTGTRPISETDLRMAAQFEQLRLIREAERPRASTRLSEFDRLTPAEEDYIRQEAERTGQAVERAREEYLARKRGEAERIARERQIGLDRLRQRLRGDLDSILRKALELDRTRRYDSPLSLANDIGAFLRGDAVPAHDAGTWYRLSKFVRRNRVAVAAVGAVMLAIVVGGAVAGWKWRDELAARREAESQRDAQTALLRFVNEALLSDESDDQSIFLAVPAHVIDAAAERLTRSMSRWPHLRATLATTLGRAYLGIGDPRRAQEILDDAAIGVGSGGSVSEEVKEQLEESLAHALMRQRETARAIGLLRGQIAQATRSSIKGRPDTLRLARLRNRLGNALKWSKQYDSAKSEYEAALSAYRSEATVPPANIVGVRTNLLLNERERWKAIRDDARARKDRSAEQTAVDALIAMGPHFDEIARDAAGLLGANHLQSIIPRIESAGCLVPTDPATAAVKFGEAVSAMRALSEQRNWRLFETLARQGFALNKAKKFDQAESVLRDAVHGYMETRGPEKQETQQAVMYLVDAMIGRDDHAGALKLLRSEYSLLSATLGPSSATELYAGRIAEILEARGMSKSAAQWRERASRGW